jgi:hypothetical protein
MSTTATDVLNKFIEMRGEQVLTGQFYDWASKEFGIISNRCGENFIQADKDLERGKMLINSLFKNDMLTIMKSGDYEKLCYELATIPDADKRKYQTLRDDLYDAMRYVLIGSHNLANFDFTAVIRSRLGSNVVQRKITLNERDEYIRKRADGKSEEQIELEKAINDLGGDDGYFEEWSELYEA